MRSSVLQSASRLTYYDASASKRTAFPALKGELNVDVCVIGGGIAGCSSALHLASRGYRVALIEENQIGAGASGRNGGQIIPGFAVDQDQLIELVGKQSAKRMWELSVAAIDLLRDLIERYSIDCDWIAGHLQTAIKPRQLEALGIWQSTLQSQYGYASTRLLDAAEVKAVLATSRYCGALRDDHAGHLHPLNLVLGIAAAAASAGAQLFEHSAALEIVKGNSPVVKTSAGTIRASQLVVCGGAYLGKLISPLQKRIMRVTTYIVATETLGQERVADLIRDNSAVADSNFILDYFRRTADHRLLFGGRVSYSGRESFAIAHSARRRMLKVFPQLADANIEFAWSGLLDITLNRAPDFGRIAPNIYYLQGFSGHGVALTVMAGKLIAEAVAGEAERFELFSRIRHREFPGGTLLRTPALMLAMLWYRLRDFL